MKLYPLQIFLAYQIAGAFKSGLVDRAPTIPIGYGKAVIICQASKILREPINVKCKPTVVSQWNRVIKKMRANVTVNGVIEVGYTWVDD